MKEIKQFPYTPQLGWSVSRYEIFTICKRQYFYQYYSKYDSEYLETTIRKYKDLVSVPLETGAIVHEMIEVMLRRLQRSSEEINTEKFLEYSKRIIQNRLENKQFEEVVYGLTDGLSLL